MEMMALQLVELMLLRLPITVKIFTSCFMLHTRMAIVLVLLQGTSAGD